MSLNLILKCFDSLYLNLYATSKKRNSAPEIPVLAIISFCQTNNVLTILNFLFYILNFNVEYKIHHYYIVFQISLFAGNYYHYETLNKRELIFNNNKVIRLNPLISYLYIVLSVLLTGLSYYILREL